MIFAVDLTQAFVQIFRGDQQTWQWQPVTRFAWEAWARRHDGQINFTFPDQPTRWETDYDDGETPKLPLLHDRLPLLSEPGLKTMLLEALVNRVHQEITALPGLESPTTLGHLRRPLAYWLTPLNYGRDDLQPLRQSASSRRQKVDWGGAFQETLCLAAAAAPAWIDKRGDRREPFWGLLLDNSRPGAGEEGALFHFSPNPSDWDLQLWGFWTSCRRALESTAAHLGRLRQTDQQIRGLVTLKGERLDKLTYSILKGLPLELIKRPAGPTRLEGLSRLLQWQLQPLNLSPHFTWQPPWDVCLEGGDQPFPLLRLGDSKTGQVQVHLVKPLYYTPRLPLTARLPLTSDKFSTLGWFNLPQEFAEHPQSPPFQVQVAMPEPNRIDATLIIQDEEDTLRQTKASMPLPPVVY